MKLETIKRNIRYTVKPYPDIYKSAERRGLKVTWKFEGQYVTVTAYDKNRHFAKTCYYLNDDTHAVYNEYSF